MGSEMCIRDRCSSAQVMESRSRGAAPSLISRRDVFVAAILVMQYACWQVTPRAHPALLQRASVCLPRALTQTDWIALMGWMDEI